MAKQCLEIGHVRVASLRDCSSRRLELGAVEPAPQKERAHEEERAETLLNWLNDPGVARYC